MSCLYKFSSFKARIRFFPIFLANIYTDIAHTIAYFFIF